MLNTICVMGRMTADPELKHTPAGVAVCPVRLAVDRDFKDRETGEREADFFTVVCWRQTAEYVARFGQKGRMLCVTGRLKAREYTDKEGIRRTATEIEAGNVYFADNKRTTDQGSQPPQIEKPDPFAPLDEDEDLPFA